MENALSIGERFFMSKISNAGLLSPCGDFTSRRTGRSSEAAKRRSYGKARDRLVHRLRTKITPKCISGTTWMQAFMIGAMNLHDLLNFSIKPHPASPMSRQMHVMIDLLCRYTWLQQLTSSSLDLLSRVVILFNWFLDFPISSYPMLPMKKAWKDDQYPVSAFSVEHTHKFDSFFVATLSFPHISKVVHTS